MDRPRPARSTYRTEGWDLGDCLLPDLDDVGSVLAWAEGEAHR